MKQWNKIIIFASILVVLILALILKPYIFKDDSQDDNSAPDPTPTLAPVLKVSEEDVETITIENEHGRIVLETYMKKVPVISIDTSEDSSAESKSPLETGAPEKYEDVLSWRLKEPDNIPVSETNLKNKISYFLDISSSEEITGDMTRIDEFGLDEPQMKVIIKLKSGEEKVVLYGDKTPTDSGYYVMLEGSGRITTVSNYKVEGANLSTLDLISTDLYEDISLPELEEITFKRSKDDLYFVARALPDEEDATTQSTGQAGQNLNVPLQWEIIKPIKSEAGYDGFMSFIQEVTSITPDKIAKINPEKEDFERYGLDKPGYEFIFKQGDKTLEILLGKDAGEGKIYGYTNYGDKVFTVYKNAFSHIDKPVKELMNSFAYMISIWEVSNIDIKIKDINIKCEIDDEQNSDKPAVFKVNGEDATVMDSSDSSYFRAFYQSVISIFIDEIHIDASPEDTGDITVTYTKKENNEKIRLSFTKKDEYTYYCFKDGVYTGFTVNSDDFYSEKKGSEGIYPAYLILKNAMDNQVNGIYD